MHIQTIEIQGKKIRYSTQGVGKTVILLHGFIERIEIWEDLCFILSKSCNVVCIELPGHGESDNINEIQTMELMAEHIHELIVKIGIEKYALIGHSMGGYVALAYAEKFSDEIMGIGLFHSNALADSEEAKIGRERAIDIINKDRDGYIFNFIPNLFAECNRTLYSEKIKWLQQGAKNMSKEALVACLKGMAERSDKISFLFSTPIPIMFIMGKEDSRSPINSTMAQALLPKHTEILILGDCGHMGYIEKQKETLNFVESFVKNISFDF
jgi:pimeloyl-ACP methyl ester carboxylesterase